MVYLRCVWLISEKEWNSSIDIFWMFGFQQKKGKAAPVVSIWKFNINNWNALVPTKRSDVSALLNVEWSSSLYTHMILQPNKERSYSALFCPSTKQKMEQFCSVCQTQNRTTPFLKYRTEPLHSSWLSNTLLITAFRSERVIMLDSIDWDLHL